MATIAAASFLARLPRGMAALAVVLTVQRATDSYALAGSAAAALAIGDAAISPLQARLIDRFDQGRVLIPSALLYAAAFVALALGGKSHAGALGMIALAGIAGMAYPPISASMKALWPLLAGGAPLLQTAYALESLIQQTFFLLGPLLVAATVAVGSPQAALLATAGAALFGTLAFVASPASRGWQGSPGRRHLLGALGDRAVRAIVLITLSQSIVFGSLYVAAPAFAAKHGGAAGAGLLLAILNVGALSGGLLGAAHTSSQSPPDRYVQLSALMALGLAPLLLASSPAAFAGCLVVAGLAIAPTAAASYVLIDLVSPTGSRTEAFAWMSTAVAGGGAVGSALAGLLVDSLGITSALAFALASAAFGAGLASFARQLLLERVLPGAT